MSAHVAASIAVGTSIIAVLGCMVFVPMMWHKVHKVRAAAELELSEFKVMEEKIWKQIAGARASNPRTRAPRQANARCSKSTKSGQFQSTWKLITHGLLQHHR